MGHQDRARHDTLQSLPALRSHPMHCTQDQHIIRQVQLLLGNRININEGHAGGANTLEALKRYAIAVGLLAPRSG